MLLPRTALALLVAPLLVAAQQPNVGQPPTTAPAGKAVAAIDKIICKKFPPPTGTRLRARQICKSQIEWDLIRHEEQDALDRVQGRKSYGGG